MQIHNFYLSDDGVADVERVAVDAGAWVRPTSRAGGGTAGRCRCQGRWRVVDNGGGGRGMPGAPRGEAGSVGAGGTAGAP